MATGRQNRGAIAVLAILAITFCVAFLIRESHLNARPELIEPGATLPTENNQSTSTDTASSSSDHKPREHRKKQRKKKTRSSKSRKPKYQPDKSSPFSDPVPRQL